MKDFKIGGAPASARRISAVGAILLAVALLIDQTLLRPSEPDGSALGPERAAARSAQSFDYYVLALSWSPAFCRNENPDREQCRKRRRFILHGLWPQFERGFPTDCRTREERPNRRLLSRYEDLTESRGLLAHQWRKHGVCSGLSAEAYFALSRRAVEAVAVPPALERATRDAVVDPGVIETAFLEANPTFSRDGVTIKCKGGDFSEVRICLTKDLAPRRCGRDVIRDCGAGRVDLFAPR